MAKGGIYLKKFTLNRKGVSELCSSSEVGNYLRTVGNQVAQQTGHPQDYDVKVYDLSHTAIGVVQIAEGNYKAWNHELKNNDLLKAVGHTGLSTQKETVDTTIPDVLEEML